MLSDDSAGTLCRAAGSTEDGTPCFSDVSSGITDRTMAAAPSGRMFSGKIITDVKEMSWYYTFCFILTIFSHILYSCFVFEVDNCILCLCFFHCFL